MTVREFIDKHGLTPVVLPEPDREVSGCYIGDLLSWVMGRAKSDNVWLTIMTNINTVAVASLTDVSLVLLTEGVALPPEVEAAAGAKGVNVASTALPTFEAAMRVGCDL